MTEPCYKCGGMTITYGKQEIPESPGEYVYLVVCKDCGEQDVV